MKQTAVEWLVEQLKTMDTKSFNRLIQIEMSRENFEECFEQAKAMEKEQSLKMPHYDLDALADEYANDMSCDDGTTEFDFKAGFQKALELLTFKSE